MKPVASVVTIIIWYGVFVAVLLEIEIDLQVLMFWNRDRDFWPHADL